MRSLFIISLALVQFLLCSICYAQPDKIDNLRKVLPSLRDTAQEDCHHESGVKYLFKANRDSTIYFANLVYEESKSIDATMLRVPPLINQPYAENAIWHGLMHNKEKGHVEIELTQRKEILICEIVDDGVGQLTAEELKTKSRPQHTSMGVKITGSRIAMTQVNGAAQLVEIKDLVYADGSAAGTEVVSKIPVNVR